MTTLDVAALDAAWDFADPEASVARLRVERDAAVGDARDEWATQVARALGLMGDVAGAQAELDSVTSESPQVLQRLALERGRLSRVTGESDQAFRHFQAAADLPGDAYLHVDALHMLAIVHPEVSAQYTVAGLNAVEASRDPRVRRWEGRLLNNHAWNLADEGAESEALAVFRAADTWFALHGTPAQARQARWCVAHLLRRTGGTAEALEILTALRESDPDDASVTAELEAIGGPDAQRSTG